MTLLVGHGTPYVHRQTVLHPRRTEVELASADRGTVSLVVLARDQLSQLVDELRKLVQAPLGANFQYAGAAWVMHLATWHEDYKANFIIILVAGRIVCGRVERRCEVLI